MGKKGGQGATAESSGYAGLTGDEVDKSGLDEKGDDEAWQHLHQHKTRHSARAALQELHKLVDGHVLPCEQQDCIGIESG